MQRDKIKGMNGETMEKQWGGNNDNLIVKYEKVTIKYNKRMMEYFKIW